MGVKFVWLCSLRVTSERGSWRICFECQCWQFRFVCFLCQGVWQKARGSYSWVAFGIVRKYLKGWGLGWTLSCWLLLFQSPSNSNSTEDVWDGETINLENVSKWVASKLKSIARCIGVAFSVYEMETIHVLSRIEKSIVPAKLSVQRSPPSSRRYRELRKLEFGVNYDRPITSSSGLKVFNG